MFARGINSNLDVNYWDGSAWKRTDPDTEIKTVPTAVTHAGSLYVLAGGTYGI